MIGKTFEDYDLPTRARQALKNQSSYPTPAELLKALKEDYAGTIEDLLRIPGCGRNTADDILRVIGFDPPPPGDNPLARFKSEEELLIHLEENDGLDATAADRPTLILLLGLVAKDFVSETVTSGHYELTLNGANEVNRLKADKPVVMTIKARLGTIRRLIDAIQDDTLAEKLEEELRELEYVGKLTVELDG